MARFKQGDPVLAQGVEGTTAGCADYIAPVFDAGRLKHLVRFGASGIGLADEVLLDIPLFRPGQLCAVKNTDEETWKLRVWRKLPGPEQRNRGIRALAEPVEGGELQAWRQCLPAQEVWPDLNLGMDIPEQGEEGKPIFEYGEPVVVRLRQGFHKRLAFYVCSLGDAYSVESLPGSGDTETVHECWKLEEACPGLTIFMAGKPAELEEDA